MCCLHLFLFQRIVFSGIAAKLFSKCTGETAGAAETYHVSDLCHGILAALYQREAFVRTIFFQISGNGFSGHFFEKAAADLPGQVHLLCQTLK